MVYAEKNGIMISKMTLGTVQLGMNYGVNNTSGMPSLRQSFDILNAAHDGGITVLDTSDDYGSSERVIGNFLKENPDKKLNICTKFKVTQQTSKDIYKSLKEFALASCKKLNIDTIPIFMSHTEQNYIEYGDDLTDALSELKKEGIILNAGLSLSKKDSLDRIVDSGCFDAIQLPLNILDNKEIANGKIEKISSSGISVFVRSVYLQGLFFKSKQQLAATKLKCAIPYIEKIEQIAKNEGISVAQLALSYIRDSKGVDSLVIGSETASQVVENITAFKAPALSENTLDLITDAFKDVDPFIISPWEWNK